MSYELDKLSKYYKDVPSEVVQKEVNIFQSSLNTAAASFIRETEQLAKRLKQAKITLVAIIPD
jgi:hypothetical protein